MAGSIACMQAKHCQQHAWYKSGGERGDWDLMPLAYRFRRANELHLCWLCQVRQDNFRAQIMRNAPFRATLRTHVAFNSLGMLLKYFAVDGMQ